MLGLLDLTREGCERRLRAGVIGRVAVSTPNGPHIVPVNYAVVDNTIVMRTTPYSVLGTYARDAFIALEIDSLDPAEETGWSVQLRGRAEMVNDPAAYPELRDRGPQPWAPGNRPLHLRMRLDRCELSGRQVDKPVS